MYSWLTDNEGRFLHVTQGLCDALGYSPEELLALAITDIDATLELRQTNGIVERNVNYTRKDGSFLQMVCAVRYEVSNGGQFFCFLYPATEVVQKKEVESQELLRMILDAQRANIVLFDADARLIWHNKIVSTSSGSGQNDLTGLKCHEVWSNCKTIGCDHCPITTVLDNGEISERKMTMLGGRRWRVTCYPIDNDAGVLQYVLFVGVDITEFLTIAEEVRQNHKLDSLGTLAGGIAHDFNNILSGILGYAELSLLIVEKGTVKTYLQEINQAGRRATELVRQILTFSRRGEGKLVRTQVPSIVKEVLKLLRSTLPTTIDLRQEVVSEVDPVLADPVHVHQIVMNLCTNASYAMEPYGGVLAVCVKKAELSAEFFDQNKDMEPGDYLELSVKDTGIGMSGDILSSVFDPYFTTKPSGHGTGLGLSVVHGIVKDSGGQISVESVEGQGTIFTVYLPTVQADIEFDESSSVELLHGTETILLVDDEPVILHVTRDYLELHGYHVVTERNSQHALDMFREAPGIFDLVITDITMPHLTGDRLAREVLAIRPDIPVILMTGYSDLISEDEIEADGLGSLLMKPLVGKGFLRKVRQLLGYRQGVKIG